MENLIYGIIIGFQFAGLLLLAALIYYLYTRINYLSDKIKTESQYSALIDENLNKVAADLKTETEERSFLIANHNSRLKMLETIEVPEHLNFTQEMIIQKELEKRLALRENLSDINFLDRVREGEIAEHNREFKRN